MNYIKHLRGFFEILESDDRMTAHHISLYMALFNLWNMNRFREQFEVNRIDLMGMSRIGSRNTYSRCMKQLHDWGYIRYNPGANRYQVSKVSCTRFDTASGTANDTGTDTTSGTASGTLLLNYSNNVKNNQYPKISKNGKGKKDGKGSCLHVNADKDYSEPL